MTEQTDRKLLEMAKEAGFLYDMNAACTVRGNSAQLERFAALVAAKERDACAQIAAQTVCDTHIPTGINIYGTRAAAAIRTRSTT